MTDLLPCPFCGSSNLRYEFCGSQGYIECNECGTQGPCDERAADPICDPGAACDAWNRRAALVQPEPQGPTNAELKATMLQAIKDFPPSHPDAKPLSEFKYELELEYRKARAVLARWGRPAIEPEERWYPNFADWLEREMPEGTVIGDPLWWASKIATYLQRYGRPAIEPVPLSERLPGPEDCDEQGRCWLGWPQMGTGTPTWILGYPAWAKRFPDVHRFWLPAHALPLPPRGHQ